VIAGCGGLGQERESNWAALSRLSYWHFGFHGARDVAEVLVAGRQRQYLQALFSGRAARPSEQDPERVDAGAQESFTRHVAESTLITPS
jgi:hypothetical protein